MPFPNPLRRLLALGQSLFTEAWRRPALLFFASLLSALAGLALLWFSWPVYSTGKWIAPGQGLQNFEYPFFAHGSASEKIIVFHMKVGPIHPTRFVAHVQDEILFLEVNGLIVVAMVKPIPPFDQVSIDLGPWLKPGDNSLRVRMVNFREDASFYLAPSLGDPWLLSLLALALFSLACALRFLMLVRPAWLETREALILFAALALRLVYVCGTPCFMRSYDWQDHLFYVRYVADHLAFPAFNLGWETYQPPLFYGLFGILGHGIYAFGGREDLALILWQLASLAIAGGTLVVALGLGRLLFPGPQNPWRLWFLSSIAALPGFVFFSGRISNDVLFALVAFAFVWAFLSFWNSRRFKTWLIASGLCAIGLLTKSSFLVFLPVVATTLFFARGIPWREKARLLATFLAVIALLAGWFQIKRASESHSATSFVVASSAALEAGQSITPSLAKLLTFNPLELVKQPFAWVGNHPRRDIFPEFFLRTALFSESHPDGYLLLGRAILLCALLLLLFLCWGLWSTLRSTSALAWPLAVIMAGFVLAQMAYVLVQPYACNQNFRFSIVLLVPFFYFIFAGIAASPPRVRSFGQITSAIFVSLGILFVLIQRGVFTS